MKISDGRTRMSLGLHQSPSRTTRDGPGDLLKRIAYLILPLGRNLIDPLLIDPFRALVPQSLQSTATGFCLISIPSNENLDES